MSQEPQTAPEEATGPERDSSDRATQRRMARRRLRAAQRELDRTEQRLESRRAEIETLKAQIAVLREEVKPLPERATAHARTADELETDRGIASFVLSARMHRRHNTSGVHQEHNLREPILDLYFKDTAREFAATHGVLVPAVLGSWPTPGDIEWGSLPDRFVVKSTRGGGGMNVFPLERRGEEFYDFIASELVTAEAVTAKLWTRHQPASAYFAEELLVGRGGTGLPHDIKVFCFYGEPAYIEVRAEDWSRSKGTVQRVRTFLPDGTELHHVRALIPRGEDIDRPHDFAAILEASSRLSGAIRRPIERIDFFETDHGIVFGEVTQNPGRPPSLVPYWDRRLGDAYENASARLFTDLVREGHLTLRYGSG